ncbi:MAG TPA: oligopeptide transporter, OPT family, partial [Saprospiraceae bacterium]|nr:oligopeptide transporter, OPT family [Saprospiraceae bacterium]
FAYALLQRVFHVISETPRWATGIANKYLPAGVVSGEITPEYLGVGYIIGPRIAGVLVAGGVLAWLGLIPLLATVVPPDTIAAQLAKLGLLDITQPNTRFGWDPATHTITNLSEAIYRAYVRQIGAGAVAGAGFITLIKTMPTIISSFQESLADLRNRDKSAAVARTSDDLSLKVVGMGTLGLILLMAILPNTPGDNIISKLLIGVLVIVFGFFFVTVASRIVGIIGSSNSPISGMTIATIMGTALVFIGVGWTGKVYEPMALVVGSLVCIAAANAGATSQDLKTGYLVGATPRYQQIALFIGVIVSSLVIGFTVQYLDTPTPDLAAKGIQHAIGETYNAPQATLMATLIKGLLSFSLDWQFVLVGLFIAVTMELCGVKSLSFAVGLYLPLATTLPIWVGGALKGATDWMARRRGEDVEDADLGKGSLFATGLVAGGALAGVIVAILSVRLSEQLGKVSAEHSLVTSLGKGGYDLLGVLFFAALAFILIRASRSK